jgi:hypothetical protein
MRLVKISHLNIEVQYIESEGAEDKDEKRRELHHKIPIRILPRTLDPKRIVDKE